LEKNKPKLSINQGLACEVGEATGKGPAHSKRVPVHKHWGPGQLDSAKWWLVEAANLGRLN